MYKRQIFRAITLCHNTLKMAGFANPRIGVAALNPHCGEGGKCGREEIDVIAPAVEKAKAAGMNPTGPISSDILFHKAFGGEFDGVVTMYHDQGLPVLKFKGFGAALNVTLGLPIIRTSVDHGTALDLAGTGKVDTGSLQVALETAYQMAGSRQR